MGTRGAYGLRYKGEDKLTYCHYDSYPTGLGEAVINFVRNHSRDEMVMLFKGIQMLDENNEPDEELINKFKEGLDKARAERVQHFRDKDWEEEDIEKFVPCHLDAPDWYEALRNIQGEPEELFNVPLMNDGNEFVYDSLFCEYAYIVNLDTCVLEIHVGFNKDPEAEGRYVKGGDYESCSGCHYYGVSHFTNIPFHQLNDIVFVEDFCESLEKEIDNYVEGEC